MKSARHLAALSFPRRVWCNGRRIDLDEAVWFMDKELFRKASASLGSYAEHQRREEKFIAETGIRILRRFDAQHEADCWGEKLWIEYLRLHRHRYSERFDPPVPDVPFTPEEIARNLPSAYLISRGLTGHHSGPDAP
jgi:hypothetical protein